MKKHFFHILFLFFLQTLSADIIQVSDLSLFKQEISRIGTDPVLVVFDVDNTLTMFKDAILHPSNDKLQKNLISHLPDDGELLLSQIYSQAATKLVDPEFPTVIQQLHQHGIKTIALTAILGGKFGVIPNVEEWRVQRLRSHGIDFSSSFPQLSGLLFPNLGSYKDGILFAGMTPKGTLLATFLDHLDWKPQKIIFIDDNQAFHQSVEEEMKKRDIAFLGFCYSAVAQNPLSIDPQAVAVQFEYLTENKVWLNDEAAKYQSLSQTFPQAEKLIAIDEATLYCRLLGQGDPIVFVHGGPGMDHSYLLPQMQTLLSDNHQLIFYDQRSCGLSTGNFNPEKISLDQYVEDLECLRQKLGLEKMTLFGHSWGGLLSLSYAMKYPQNLNSLILMSTCPVTGEGYRVFEQEAFKRLEPSIEALQKLESSAEFFLGDSVAVNRYYRTIFSTYCVNPEDANKITLKENENKNGLKINKILTDNFLSKNYSLISKLADISCPTLIIHGKEDAIPFSTCHALNQGIKNSKLLILENTGHFPYVECPDRVFPAIQNFLLSE